MTFRRDSTKSDPEPKFSRRRHFIHELALRLARIGSDMVAAAAHPGYAATNLQTADVRMEGRKVAERIVELGNRIFAQSADAGARPTLYAATVPGVSSDAFTDPRVQGWRGADGTSWRAPWTHNDVAGERLWAASEHLTGVSYDTLRP